jgi:hypothetical protein
LSVFDIAQPFGSAPSFDGAPPIYPVAGAGNLNGKLFHCRRDRSSLCNGTLVRTAVALVTTCTAAPPHRSSNTGVVPGLIGALKDTTPTPPLVRTSPRESRQLDLIATAFFFDASQDFGAADSLGATLGLAAAIVVASGDRWADCGRPEVAPRRGHGA